VWSIGWLSNKWLPVGVAVMLLFQLAFNYLPWMNQIFHSKPVDALSWLAAFVVALSIYAIIGLEKWIRFGGTQTQ
jgi:Ca2+-transporting ATPase